jgi:release factor glutamine methyltransferase
VPAVQATIGGLLRDAAERLTQSGSETPRLDAEVLLGHVLRVDRATLLAGPEYGVGPERAIEFQALITRRASGEPVSYIRGLKEFYGLAFSVDDRALIPRPETETLVELALDRIGAALISSPRLPNQPLRVWDVGTGSGAIAIAVAAECRRRGYGGDVTFYASDISAVALGLAVENAVGHGVADVIAFATADLTDGAEFPVVDVLLANLPYIATDVMPTLPIAASFEPVSALDGGPDGLDLIRRLIAQLPESLNDDGIALLEIGSAQPDAVVAAAKQLGDGWHATVRDDLGGRPRVVEIMRSI